LVLIMLLLLLYIHFYGSSICGQFIHFLFGFDIQKMEQTKET